MTEKNYQIRNALSKVRKIPISLKACFCQKAVSKMGFSTVISYSMFAPKVAILMPNLDHCASKGKSTVAASFFSPPLTGNNVGL